MVDMPSLGNRPKIVLPDLPMQRVITIFDCCNTWLEIAPMRCILGIRVAEIGNAVIFDSFANTRICALPWCEAASDRPGLQVVKDVVFIVAIDMHDAMVFWYLAMNSLPYFLMQAADASQPFRSARTIEVSSLGTIEANTLVIDGFCLHVLPEK